MMRTAKEWADVFTEPTDQLLDPHDMAEWFAKAVRAELTKELVTKLQSIGKELDCMSYTSRGFHKAIDIVKGFGEDLP